MFALFAFGFGLFGFCCYCFAFFEKNISLYNCSWLGTYCVHQTGLKLGNNLRTSAS